MKKSTLVLIIIAASLVVAGILLCVVGLALASGDTLWNGGWIALGTKNTATNEFEMTEEISDVEIVVNTTDVEILPATDGVTKVICREDERDPHMVCVEDGTLKIRVGEIPWYRKISFFSLGERKITVYLAESKLDRLSVETDTGDIRVAKDFLIESATLMADTGEIDFGATVAEKLLIHVDTGDVSLCGVHADEIEVTSSTGDQTYESVVCRTLVAKSSTGEQEYSSVDCRNLTVTSSTGEQEYRAVTVAEKMTLKATTGDVSIFDCSAAEVSITTDTGDVDGRFATEMIFFAHTDTGRVHVPKSTVGGSCEITTDTGNIEFSEP